MGFLAFSVTVGLGLAAGITHDVIIFRAISAMFLFFFLGLFTGWVAYRVIDEHIIAMHREMFREVEEESGDKAGSEVVQGVGENTVSIPQETNMAGATAMTAG
ncbi:MAG: hypothetical protein GXY44_06195 [Phycisphaerales bacterium]|nr:hypothetical protein [Phycisphaerales bacterium]